MKGASFKTPGNPISEIDRWLAEGFQIEAAALQPAMGADMGKAFAAGLEQL